MFLGPLKRSMYLLLSIIIGLIAYNAAHGNLRSRYVSSHKHFLKRFSTSSSSSSSSFPQYPNLSSKYNVAVAFQPKNIDQNELLNEHFKTKKIDSPTGEDNYFVAHRPSDDSLSVGVADGVGGWAELGLDSSAISRELCKTIAKIFESAKDPAEAFEPKLLLDQAFQTIRNENIVQHGGTTACLGVFKPNGYLKVANLGDSWCGIFRNNKLIAETKAQTYGFNTPYQLSIKSGVALERGNLFTTNYPVDADEYIIKLQKGDLVVFATDGVTDNIYPEDISLFLKDNQDLSLSEQATKLVSSVHKVTLDENFPSVFTQELTKLTGQFYSGGKEDDITVVLVKVN